MRQGYDEDFKTPHVFSYPKYESIGSQSVVLELTASGRNANSQVPPQTY